MRDGEVCGDRKTTAGKDHTTVLGPLTSAIGHQHAHLPGIEVVAERGLVLLQPSGRPTGGVAGYDSPLMLAFGIKPETSGQLFKELSSIRYVSQKKTCLLYFHGLLILVIKHRSD